MTSVDFADVRGLQSAKRALEIAAAGGHATVMLGRPGSGRTMLARRVPSILPLLTTDEAHEVRRIYMAGSMPLDAYRPVERPFRAPHHTASPAGLVGSHNRPGEVSLAHLGCLFLDELEEFRGSTLRELSMALRQGFVHTRDAGVFSAKPLVVAALSPCPCGGWNGHVNKCRCSKQLLASYLNRGERFAEAIAADIYIELPATNPQESLGSPDSSAAIRERVTAARKAQMMRQHSLNAAGACLADMRKQFTPSALAALERAFPESVRSRAYASALCVSRTIADLHAYCGVHAEHVEEAMTMTKTFVAKVTP